MKVLHHTGARGVRRNEFVVGAIGKKYNRGDNQYVECLDKKIDRKRLIFGKTKDNFRIDNK